MSQKVGIQLEEGEAVAPRPLPRKKVGDTWMEGSLSLALSFFFTYSVTSIFFFLLCVLIHSRAAQVGVAFFFDISALGAVGEE